VQQKLADANPAVTLFQSDLARCHYRTGRLLARLGHAEQAVAALDRGQALCKRLADADRDNARYRLRLGYSHAFRGAAHAHAGRSAQAAADLRQALELWATNKTPNAEDHFERARALALLAGPAADARSGVTAAEAKGFADEAVTALRNSIQTGWLLRDQLKVPDFDALRKREDFQKLQAELQKTSAAADQEP
jgi:tetratricopeptide (TPR) repeat protein